MSVVTVSSLGVVPNSASYTFTSAGPDSWDAVYSGNGANNPATSPCEPMNVTRANTSITTTLSSSSITTGGSVHDTATLFGATATAGGTVTYEFFSGPNCSGSPTVVSTVTVTGAVVPPSASQVFGTAGQYGWKAIYSGDANNFGSSSSCEPLSVSAPANVTITTNLSAPSITVGGSVHDTALLFGATATAGGSVTYEYFASSNCAGSPTVVVTVTVTNGNVPDSTSVTFSVVGAYSWRAIYSGDANNLAATSACEPLLVNKAMPTITTNLTVTANVSGPFHITSTAGDQICGLAFNSFDHYVYATSFTSSTVLQISDITNSTVATIPVGQGPCAIAYDSHNHDMYVADTDYFNGAGAVTVTSGASVVATVSLPSTVPEGIAFDPVNDVVYVGAYSSPIITMICDGGSPCGGPTQANHVVGTINLGSTRAANFGAAVVDTLNGRVFVPVYDISSGHYYVTVLSGNSILTSIPVPAMLGSDTGAFDPANSYVYISNDWLFAATVVVISGAADTYLGTVHLINPGGGTAGGITVDSATGEVFATQPHGDLNIISGSTVVNHLPYPAVSVTYDSSRGAIYLGLWGSPTGSVEVLTPGYTVTDSATVSGTTPGATGTVTYVYFAGSSCGWPPTVVSTVPFTGNPVASSTPHFFPSESFSYAAFYSGDANNAPAMSPCEPLVPPIRVNHIPPFPTHFVGLSSTSTVHVLATLPDEAQVGVSANGTVIDQVDNSTVLGSDHGPWLIGIPDPSPGTYHVQIAGFANDSRRDGTPFTLLLGSFGANGTVLGSVEYSGRVLAGTFANVTLTLAANGSLAFSVQPYTIAFGETGIPAKMLATSGWSVTLNGATVHSTQPSITFTEPAGVYSLLVAGPRGYVSSVGGPASVTGNLSVPVTFSQGPTPTLVFHERGLPSGQSWCAEVDSSMQCSTSQLISYHNLTAGMYSYAVVSPLVGENITAKVGRTAVLPSGTLNLTKSTGVQLTFLYEFPVTFTESGLSAGNWSVTIHHVTEAVAAGSPIVFELTNHTYRYKIGAVTGYQRTGTPRQVTVNGAPASVSVTFTKKTAAVQASAPMGSTVTGRGVPIGGGALGAITLGIAGALGLAVLVAAWTIRRDRTGSSER